MIFLNARHVAADVMLKRRRYAGGESLQDDVGLQCVAVGVVVISAAYVTEQLC